MPFNDNLPASGTKPWYTPFNTAWTNLKTFVNGLETSIANIELTPGPKGDPGDDGTDATITGVSAVGLPAGASPTVTAGGTPSARTFQFGIPKGDPGDGGGGGAVASVNGKTGAVVLVPGDLGAATATDLDNVFTVATDAQTDATSALSGLSSKANTSDVVPNTRTVAGKPLSANVTIAKGDVGLASVDNTSDAQKPVSTAQQTALDTKVPTSRTVAGKPLSADVSLAKTDVGLGNVDNTSDANKPVSTAQQTALNAKVNTSGVATLSTIGWLRGAPIPNGGTVPAAAGPWDIIVEAAP